MKSEVLRVTHELQAMKDKIKENTEKIKVNKTLPYLVSNVIEVGEIKKYVHFCLNVTLFYCIEQFSKAQLLWSSLLWLMGVYDHTTVITR